VGQVTVTDLPPPKIPSEKITIPHLTPDQEFYEFMKTQIASLGYARTASQPSPLPTPQPSPQAAGGGGVVVGGGPSTFDILTGFDGINKLDSGFNPPDVEVAVGPNHVFEVVNSNGRIWTKTGTQVDDFLLKDFFLSGSNSPVDPKLLYDSLSGRWFASSFVKNIDSVRLAVSATDDPTGTWAVYNIPYDFAVCPDQPKMGISDDKFVISTNDFSLRCTGNFLGNHIIVFDKNELIAGSTLTKIQDLGVDFFNISMMPAQSLSSTSTLYLAGVRGDSIRLFTIEGTSPNTSLTTLDFTIPNTSNPPDGIQAFSNNLVQTSDNRIRDGIWYQGKFWLASQDACTPLGGIQTRSCLHFFQINTDTSTLSQNFRLTAVGFEYFYPALSIDTFGGLGVVFGFSSIASFPSIAITGQPAYFSPNTIENPVALKAGTEPVVGTRYGDYFGAATDPTDPTTIWVAGQYHIIFEQWSTWINQISVNARPTANAGPDQTVDEGKLVTLDGSTSADPNADSLTFTWSQTSGPSVTLTNPTSANPTFTAPSVESATAITFSLTVNDGLVDSNNSDTVTVTVNVDATPPAAPTITSPTSGTTTNDNTVTISGDAESLSTVEVFDGAASLGTTTANSPWSFTTPALSDGDHTLTATATDAAGNTSSSSASVTVTVDITPPAAPTITSPTSGTTTNDNTVTISGDAESLSTVEVFDGAASLGTTTANSPWSFTTPALSDGDHTFTATATDAAGNTSPSSASVTVTVEGTWGQADKQTPSDGAAGDEFGHGVAISVDTVVVGALRDDDDGNDSGSAYIFERNQGGADNWGQVKKITSSDGTVGDSLGHNVAISGDTVVAGAQNDDDNGNNSGSAYIFERNQGGADNWGQVKKLLASDGAAGDNFGHNVAISGDTVVVGALLDDDDGNDSGSVYIFERNQGGADNWSQVKKLLASDGAAGDNFGHGFAISGDTVVVGAHLDDDDGNDSGSVYIFERNQGGADNWGQVKKILASDGAAGDNFGIEAAISGDTVVVGAQHDDDDGNDSGSAYIFERNQGGADNWGQVKKILASDGAAGDEFGHSVSISGGTFVVGADGDDSSSGSAYIFERNQGGADNWGQVKKITASDGAVGDSLGHDVAISGDTVVAGAQNDDDNGIDSGSAYTFSKNTVNCSPPVSGNWIITSSCTLDSTITAPANVKVQNNSVLTIPAGLTLTIDFSQFNLTVEFGSGVLIKAGGTISSPAGGLG